MALIPRKKSRKGWDVLGIILAVIGLLCFARGGFGGNIAGILFGIATVFSFSSIGEEESKHVTR